MGKSDLESLEKKYFADRKSVSVEELFELTRYKIENLERDLGSISKQIDSKSVKQKESVKGRAFYFINEAYKAGRKSQSDLEFYIDSIKNIIKHPVPSKFIAQWMKVTGKGDVKNLKVKRGNMGIESGSFGVGDVTLSPSSEELASVQNAFTSKGLVTFVNEGRVVYVGMGGDGTVGAELRLVEGDEPLISAKEYKISQGEVGPYYMKAPSGEIRIADMSGLPDKDKEHWLGVEMEIDPGNYKVMVYLLTIPDKFYKFVAVFAKTKSPPVNTSKKIHILEG